MSNLRISTITAISQLSSQIDLEELFCKVKINDTILYIENGSDKYKGYAKKFNKKARKPTNKCRFYNQSTLHLFNKKIINIKLFNNGKIQLTGIRNREDIVPTINILINELVNNSIIPSNTTILSHKIVLINSDFDIGYKVNREILYRYINHIGLFCTYEPCTYPGVNIKYYVNENNTSGICGCSSICIGKGNGIGDNNCKKVTIAVFKSGKIIITGGQNLTQVNEVYNFINNLLKKNKGKFVLE